MSWDNDDPTDYLAAGWWLRFPGVHPPRLPISRAKTQVFIDGPEIDPSRPPDLPVSGTATYVGGAGGLYSYRYGSNWSGFEDPEVTEEIGGIIDITANFDDNTISGCIGCTGDLEIGREHLYVALRWRAEVPLALPTDYELHFGMTDINPNGTFDHNDVTVQHPERTVTSSSGAWAGTLSNRPDPDGNPRLAAGIARAEFSEDDGSQGAFDTLFLALGDSLRPLPPGANP